MNIFLRHGKFYMVSASPVPLSEVHVFRSAHVNEMTNFGNAYACKPYARFSLLFILLGASGEVGGV